MHLHFVGIGGIGISALARYYHGLGYSISGSSDSDSDLIHSLQAEGITVHIGHASENLPGNTAKVIYTSAIIGVLGKEE